MTALATPRSLAAHASRRIEPITEVIEHSPWLDAVARAITRLVGRILPPGAVKDVLSGTWMGHPAHPMLTDVPIGAWTSALVLDLLGGKTARSASDALVGLGTAAALPTAITGLSDLADVVKRDERAMGAAHALGNSFAVVLYGSAYVARRRGRRPLGLVLSLLGAAVVTASGFLGGHLSYRRGIGVDHTVFREEVGEWTAVLDDGALEEGMPRRVRHGIEDVMLVRAGSRIYAIANRCSHRGGPLHKGRVLDGTVRCPWHLSTFSLQDGSIVQGPATSPQPAFDVRVVEGRVEIRDKSRRSGS